MKKILGVVDKRIFLPAVIVFVAMFLYILLAPENAAKVISTVLDVTVNKLGVTYILAYILIAFIFLYLGFSKYGKIRLGGPDAKPEFSFFTWMGMLFGAGLGVGLVFFGVTEPVSHFVTPPYAESLTVEAAQDAMRITFFHWSFLPWMFYGIVGLAMAYFAYNKKLPGLVSSALQPLIGDNIGKTTGKIVDCFALLAIICGVSMSTGTAGSQIVSGLNITWGMPISFTTVALIIIGVGLVGTLSCISGVAKGVKVISDANMWIVLVLIGFSLIFGPTQYLIQTFFENMGNLLQNFVYQTFFSDAYHTVEEHVGFNWVGSWTIFYWAWWVAFGPFVGGFLFRASKGRTLREFVTAVTLVPGLLCCVWFNNFGGGAIYKTLFEGSDVAIKAAGDSAGSLFYFLQELPLWQISIPIAIVLIFTLITTSFNSGTFVAGNLSAGGDVEPTIGMRAFWGSFMVINAILYYWIGGLTILQNLAIAMAFPFIIITMLMCVGLFKGVKSEDLSQYQKLPEADAPAEAAAEETV